MNHRYRIFLLSGSLLSMYTLTAERTSQIILHYDELTRDEKSTLKVQQWINGLIRRAYCITLVDSTKSTVHRSSQRVESFKIILQNEKLTPLLNLSYTCSKSDIQSLRDNGVLTLCVARTLKGLTIGKPSSQTVTTTTIREENKEHSEK